MQRSSTRPPEVCWTLVPTARPCAQPGITPLWLLVYDNFSTEVRTRMRHHGAERTLQTEARCLLSSWEWQLSLTGVGAVGHDQHPQRGEVDVPLIPVCHQRPVHVPGLDAGHFC